MGPHWVPVREPCAAASAFALSEVVAPCSVAGAGHAAASAVDAHKLEPSKREVVTFGARRPIVSK